MPDAGDALEAEAVQEERAETTENRVVGSRQGGVVRAVLARQLLGFRDCGGEAVPGKNGLDGGEGVATGIARLNQRIAQSGEEPDLVVDGAGIGLQRFGGAALCPAEEPTDQSVEHANGLVGEASNRFQRGDGEDGPAAQRRQRLQVLR